MCKHTITTFDSHVGEEICIECGVVIDTVLYTSAQHSPSIPMPDHELDNFGEKMKMRETVLDVCSQLHLDATCIIDSVIHVMQNVLKIFPYCKFSLFSTKGRSILAYSICEVLNRQKTPRFPKEVASVCDIVPAEILKIEKAVWLNGGETTHCMPSMYANYACCQLGLSFSFSKEVQEVLRQTEEVLFGHTPEALTAAAILHILRGRSDEKQSVDRKTLITHFRISARTIDAICKKFDKVCAGEI